MKTYYQFLLLCFAFTYQNMVTQNIKTVQLRPINSQQFSPIVPLGNILELSFDDLDADNKEYQYKIEHMTHDWKPSNLTPSQYINGFNQNYFTDVTNSFNTLQEYTHYSARIPNENTTIIKSGNYLVSVLNEDDEVVFSRKCVFYENITSVGVGVFRSRNTKTLNQQQTVQFLINYKGININNPSQEIKTVLFKNHNWNTAITNLRPQFFKPNQLIYKYINKTNFWGGNEYLNFDSKNIRITSLNIAKTERKDVFHNYLYTDKSRDSKPYSYNPDINGQFVVRTLEGEENSASEADYATMHFTLEAYEPYYNKDVYVYGAFNNFELLEENKMTYNSEAGIYELQLPLKQGFYNYLYATVDADKNVDLNEINGSFSETENEYTVIVYYRPFGSFYDRVIGVGNGFFDQNR